MIGVYPAIALARAPNPVLRSFLGVRWVLLAGAILAAGCQFAPAEGPESQTAGLVEPGLSLAVDAVDGSLLKADDGGLFRSADQGRSWQALPVPAALRPERLRHVATTGAAPSSVYGAGEEAGIVRSDNRGQTWRRVSDGLPSQAVGAFAVHSFRPDTLFAWIDGGALFQTEDGGARWQKIEFGPPVAVGALAHSTLEGSMNTGWVYAATPEGPYLSMD